MAEAYEAARVASLASGRVPLRGGVTMASAAKTYVVEDAGESAKSGIPPGVFPGTLAGLVDALDAARYRSAATGTPKVLAIVEGKQRTVIRRLRAARRRGRRPGSRSSGSANTAGRMSDRGES
jgi:hypothetical protein